MNSINYHQKTINSTLQSVSHMRKILVLPLIFAFCSTVYAGEMDPKVIRIFKTESVKGKMRSSEIIAGLNMAESMSDCTQIIGKIKVAGVQFSPSGMTLERFSFADKSGKQWSIPTGFDRFSNAERGNAGTFIKVGKSYFLQIEVCGSGGYPNLINMYDDSIGFGN